MLLILASVAALGAIPAAASAAKAPRGKLTATEYAQLKSAMAGVATAVAASHWATATKVCEQLSVNSRLMVAERVDCNAGIEFFRSAAQLDAVPKTCAEKRKPAARAKCLAPSYRRLASATATLYRVENALRVVVLARGFSGACVQLLANSKPALDAERDLVADTRKMAIATANYNGLLLLSSARAFQKDADALQTADSNDKTIDVCPHRGGGTPPVGLSASASRHRG
jgi:hypothetical protein